MNKRILLISARPQSLILKMLEQLKNYGETYLFSMSKNFREQDYIKNGHKVKSIDFMGRSLLKNKNPRIIIEVLKFFKEFFELRKINPDIIIAEGEPNWTCALAKIIFKNKIFIYFPYDITSFAEILRGKISIIEKKAEKYCFENSDIIIHKGPEKELEWLNYKIKGKHLQILPACEEKWFSKIKKIKKKEITLVYIGIVTEGSTELNMQWKDQLKIFANQKIFSHVYATDKFTDPKNRYIEIHKPISQKKLNKIMSKYHYGLYTADYKIDKKDTRWIRSTIGNKLFSYFEAGIPVIVDEKYEYIAKLVKEYNCGIIISKKDYPNLKKIIGKQDYGKLLKGVEKIRKEMTIKKYLNNLIKEIEKLEAT